MAFTVEQSAFSGPLGLLLELLEQKKLEITEVALASITEAYLDYLNSHEIPSDELADFLLIASRLIYLKSRALLPYLEAEAEEDAVSLEEQLRVYRLFADAADRLAAVYSGPLHSFRQPFSRIVKSTQEVQFSASQNVNTNSIHEAFTWILKRLQPFFALREVSMERVKSVEERLREMTSAIASRAKMGFRDVMAGAKSRAEVVVSFMALLELMRRRIVKASQTGDNDIEIVRL
ncbi:MAG: segregation/condensation protein A [Patescibacteria group bacterium]|jgi:segregation and condensation protein A